jgi:arginine deiminase
MIDKIKIDLTSEIGELESVIIHTPGSEVENMTPTNAERALYSDILNLSVARKEYEKFKKLLGLFAKTYELADLLVDTLNHDKFAKEDLLKNICKNESVDKSIRNYLLELPNEELAEQLIEGVPLQKDTLTKYFSNERYALLPLHNFFFIRDPSVAINDKVLISRMASKVRERESLTLETIFNYHPNFNVETVNPERFDFPLNDLHIEGGDVLVAREDVLLIGVSSRTTSKGIDFLLERIKERKRQFNILVQELPEEPESFIHLDMVFTFLDKDKCLIYEPVILNQHSFQTVRITVDNGKVTCICEEKNLIDALRSIGFEVDYVRCGGDKDEWIQEREQWHSGANFFAVGPGKVIGYGRNIYTIEELNKHGFEIVNADDVLTNKVDIFSMSSFALLIEGAELSRGGGGCRCMTMPLSRKKTF